ncbi:MAG: phosphate ABC transporter ATP-binding protein PstB [Myxococcota bacterium]
MAATKLTTRSLNVFYGSHRAIRDVDLDIDFGNVTAFIGPSGCGKSTVLRCFNRMNDTVAGCRVEGRIALDDRDINAFEVEDLRRQVGMVFQKSNPFPMSIYDNVAYGLRVRSRPARSELDARVQTALEQAGLWDETRERLTASALDLSGGQQQRLCIARALAIEPEVILMDEPASALDPIATARLESLIAQLRDHYTVVIVTHNMQQARRVSDRTAFFYMGSLIEFGDTAQIFEAPENEQTRSYIEGAFG